MCKKKKGVSVGIKVSIDQEKLFETIPAMLADLEELNDLISEWNQPEAEEIIKRLHGLIADLIDVK